MSKSHSIIQLGDPRLRQIAQTVDDFSDAKFQQLLAIMQKMMIEANGVGIAAPQLGESWRIVIIASRPTLRYPHAPEMPATVMINPSYEIVDAAIIKDWEGCLSVPGIRAQVPRYRAVKVFFQDQEGSGAELLLADFPARVFQHEFDHLHGLVYLDRVEDNRDIIAESEYLKLLAA